MSSQHPLKSRVERIVAATAAGSSASFAFMVAAFAGVVSAVSFVPVSDITGADTNTRKLELVNKGSNGNGSTVIASIQFDSGVDANDFDEKALTLSATAANLVVAEGDVLAWVSTKVGTGLADVGGLARVILDRS